MEWIAWTAFSVFVATSVALAALLAVWTGQSALGSGWSRTSGVLWLGSLLVGWGGIVAAVKLFRWLQPDPRHAEGLGLYLAGIIAFNPDWLGKPLAYAMYWLLTGIIPAMAFLLAIVPFLLNAWSFYRQKRLLAGFGLWLLAVALVSLVLVPAVASLVAGPKTEVFRVFYAVMGSSRPR